jgi:hypothetical protein
MLWWSWIVEDGLVLLMMVLGMVVMGTASHSSSQGGVS